MIQHLRIQARKSLEEPLVEFSVPLPPAILFDTSAGCMLSAMKRFTDFMLLPAHTATARPPKVMVTLVISDSAAACLYLGKHLDASTGDAADQVVLHSRCQHHMYWQALTSMLLPMKFMNPLFCATIILHKSSFLFAVRQGVKTVLRSRLNIIYRPSSAQDREYNKSVLCLLQRRDSFQEEDGEFWGNRLLDALHGRWTNSVGLSTSGENLASLGRSSEGLERLDRRDHEIRVI